MFNKTIQNNIKHIYQNIKNIMNEIWFEIVNIIE